MLAKIGFLIFFWAIIAPVGAATYHVSQEKISSDKNPGTETAPFKTISQAARIAQPGDTVIVHGGVYRECVRPVRGGTGPEKMITYQAAKGEEVVIKGSKVFGPAWQPAMAEKECPEGFVKADLPEDFFEPNPRFKKPDGKPAIYNPFKTPLLIELLDNAPFQRYRNRTSKDAIRRVVGEVFVLGKPLRQVFSRQECQGTPGSYWVPIDGKQLFVHFLKFTKGEVELTIREQCFAPAYRGLGYIRVSGFIMEQCANQGPFPQAGILSTRSGHHWIIENNILRHAATIGLDCGSEIACFYKYPKNDTSVEGEWAPGSTPATYEKAFKEKGWESPLVNHVDQPAPAVGHIVRNNVVSDNGLCGIQALKADDLLIEGNIVERNNRRRLYASVEDMTVGTCETGGIKLHLTKNTVIRNNLIRDNYGWAPGIWLDNNNDNARVTGNLILNNWYGVDLEINPLPILVDNNIIAFSKVDGFSCRDSSQTKFIHNTVLYSGRWGCIINYTAQRGSYFSRTFGPPRNCLIANNVFAGSVEKCAIRLPMPTKELHDNIVTGNLICHESSRFQLEDFRQNIPFDYKNFVATAAYWLTEKKLPKNLWPDFNSWKVNDRWNVGECTFAVFNAITGSPDNHFQDFKVPDICGRMDQFSNPSPNAWPARETYLPGLQPEYLLRVNSSGWPRIQPVKEVDRDYFANPIDPKHTLPGAVQETKEKDLLFLWPKKSG